MWETLEAFLWTRIQQTMQMGIEEELTAFWLRTDAAKLFKKTANSTATIWRLLLVAEKRFRKIDTPHLASEIHRGSVFEDGLNVTK